MIPILAPSFQIAARTLRTMMRAAPQVRTDRWQGRSVVNDPSARTYELRNVVMEVDLLGKEGLDHYRDDIRPNLPWADDHFLERVGGEPLNPGVQWENWPWASSADKFRTEQIFNHTYMERFWPKFAQTTPGGRLYEDDETPIPTPKPHQGISRAYGDLNDLVDLLVDDPTTRQAWIPLFFPEDTGPADGGRKPCTLGYQVLVRGGQAHLWYPLRSCDFIRHWPDDCYLAVRLLLWIIDQCRVRSEFWHTVKPGPYGMHMTSLHLFENDRRNL